MNIEVGGRRLDISYEIGGGCSRFDYVKVVETSTAVTLSPIFRFIEPPPGAVCSLFIEIGFGYVQLQQPLGSRALMHPAQTAMAEG